MERGAKVEKKTAQLIERLKTCGSLVVALSGGVDSATLAKAAGLALGDKAVAVTARSELLAAEELADARKTAEAAGLRHVVLDVRDLDDPQIVANDKERCYYCKRGRFQKLCAWAEENGFAFVADGSNLDDGADYRPGMRAIAELAPKVISPFMECGWTKADIRERARAWGLSVAEKPSAACLASRIAYDLPLTAERLAVAESAPPAVATVGVLQIAPGVMNVIPGSAELGVDIRSIDGATKTRVADKLKAAVSDICERRGVVAEIVPISDERPVAIRPSVLEYLDGICREADCSYMRLPSGAGHDAMHWAERVPTGMLFIPCRDGVSHNPEEYAAPDDILNAVRLLEKAVREASKKDVTFA